MRGPARTLDLMHNSVKLNPVTLTLRYLPARVLAIIIKKENDTQVYTHNNIIMLWTIYYYSHTLSIGYIVTLLYALPEHCSHIPY